VLSDPAALLASPLP